MRKVDESIIFIVKYFF